LSRLPRPQSLLLALVLIGTGCANSGPVGSWGDDLTDTERTEIAAALPAEAVSQLLPLSEIFYGRITSRRFNSRATFEDPSVRQFFPDVASYSDYYAALVDALDRANIRYNRPTRVELLGVEVSETGNLMLDLRFVGRNDLPLRWWSTSLARKDEWRWQEGRWFLVPGKV
jgi:hypothetical protein